jgi:predicted MFS family arabinose efflux permease
MQDQITASTRLPLQTLNMKLVWLLTVAAGITVANLYYNQPLLAQIADNFQINAGQVGFLGTLTQLGYAAGLLFLVPLGDSKNRRSLILILLILEAVALLANALAPQVAWISITSFAIGFFTVVPQIILPLAASLASEQTRGRVVGTILSGILFGILLARTVSGFIGGYFGWQAMFIMAAVLMLILALILWRTLPSRQQVSSTPYRQLIVSLWHLLRTERRLIPIYIFGALAFATFNIFWGTLAFYLQTPPYAFGSDVVGLFGIVGIVGALAAPFFGRLTDRTGKPRLTIVIGLATILLSFAIFWLLGNTLWGLVIGVIVLDLGVQVNLISCQAIVQSILPEARSRLNTLFMTSYFLGGAAGTSLGTAVWGLGHWSAVCLSGGILMALALLIFLFTTRR